MLTLSNRLMVYSGFLQNAALFSRHCTALTLRQCGMKLFFPLHGTKPSFLFSQSSDGRCFGAVPAPLKKEYKNRGFTGVLKLSFFLIIALSRCAEPCIWVCLLCLSSANTKGNNRFLKCKKNDTLSPCGLLSQCYRIEGN